MQFKPDDVGRTISGPRGCFGLYANRNVRHMLRRLYFTFVSHTICEARLYLYILIIYYVLFRKRSLSVQQRLLFVSEGASCAIMSL